MTVAATPGSASCKSGRYARSGRSSSRRPSSTSRIAAVAVKVLVIEPTWNRVSSSTGSGLSMLVTPNAAVCSTPSWSTPTATPGTRRRVTSASTKLRNSSNSASPTRRRLARSRYGLVYT